jgi:16S rRNA (cytidine1402-2'-O)-methyltransferase
VARDDIKGEITLLIGKFESVQGARFSISGISVRSRVRQIMAGENVDEKVALKKVAKERGISKSEAYRELQRTK